MKLFRMSKEYKKAASNKKNALIQREKNKYGKCERADTKVKKEMLSEKDILTAGVKNGGYDLGADTVIGIKSADSIGPPEVRATRPSKMRYDISDEDDRAIWSDKGKLVSDIDLSATVKKQCKRKSVAACNFHKMEIDIPTGLNGYESDLTESTMGMTEYNSSSSDEESVQGKKQRRRRRPLLWMPRMKMMMQQRMPDRSNCPLHLSTQLSVRSVRLCQAKLALRRLRRC